MNSESQEGNTVTIKVCTVGFSNQLKWCDCRNLTTPQHKMLTLALSYGKLEI